MGVLNSDDRGVLMSCPACGRTNRMGYAHLGRSIRCGHCHTTLAPPAAPVDASQLAAFDALLVQSALPFVVDFWAPWCGPCRAMAPELDKLAGMMAGEVVVVKVNTDLAPELGERYRIRSIPTLALFQNGAEVARRSGTMPAPELRDFIADALASKQGG